MQFWIDSFGSEWPYVTELGAAIVDPEEKKAFWENIKEAKLKDPGFSIYELFPPIKKRDFGIKVCEEILADLAAKGFGKAK